MDNLLNCPWCGSPAKYESGQAYKENERWVSVICSNGDECGVLPYIQTLVDKKDVEKAKESLTEIWNKRI